MENMMSPKIALILLSAWWSVQQACATEWWLFFDVNKTVLMSDAASGKSSADVIAGMFAESKEYAIFGDNEQETYYEYLTRKVQKLGILGEKGKEKRNKLLLSVLAQLEKKMKPEESESLKERVKRCHQILEESAPYGGLIPSFRNLLHVLEQQKKSPYKVIFRTFGTDLPHIQAGVQAIFPSLSFVSGEFTEDQFEITGGEKYPRLEFYHSFTQYSDARFFAFRDHYPTWEKSGFTYKGGKPFPLFGNAARISVFFDDNIREKILFPYKGGEHGLVPSEDGMFVTMQEVDSLQALEKDGYYLEKLQEIAGKLGVEAPFLQ